MSTTPESFLYTLASTVAKYMNGPPIRKEYLDLLQGSRKVLGLNQAFELCMDRCAEDGTDDEIRKFAHVRDTCGKTYGESLRRLIVKYLRGQISEPNLEELKGRLQTVFDNHDYEQQYEKQKQAEEYEAAIEEVEHAEVKNEYDEKLDEMIWNARKNPEKKRQILKTKLRLRTDPVYKEKYDEMVRVREERKKATVKASRKAGKSANG